MNRNNHLEWQRARVVAIAREIGVTHIGFADLASVNHALTERLPTGISLVMAMNAKVVQSGNEAAFHDQQMHQRDALEAAKAHVEAFLCEQGHKVFSVGNESDPERLKADISNKMIAVRAGMGWIGKSSLLVTPQFGPRVRLTSMLTNTKFTATTHGISASQCGACQRCVHACPVNAIRNQPWTPERERETLLDPNACNEYRLRMGHDIGRKHACAECIRVCPVGR